MKIRPAAMRAFAACAVLLWAAAVGAENRDDWQQPDRIVADMALPAGAVVADVGCGEGYLAFRLAKQVGESGKVFAMDISSKALDAVRRRITREHRNNMEVIQSGSSDTRLQTASVESAVLCDVLHEMPVADRLPLVRDIVRALKPGGLLFLIDYRKSHDVKFDPYEKLIPREDLLKLANDAGLALDAEFHYLKYQVFLRLRKPARTPR
ncbi:MAG: class I SAM-dependent methyltransferase [Verrucomicrobia bacterium]|nr:class I SAM-dependent methyltransferase [Verrucomicrobiota bacterium]